MKRSALLLAFLSSFAQLAVAAPQLPPPPPAKTISAAERKAVVAELGKQMQANYIFPEVAERVGAALRAKEAGGGYASAKDTSAFAEALTADLHAQGDDLHLNVMFDPEFEPEPADAPMQDTVPAPEELEHAARVGYGVESVQRLPGNVGYLDVRGFGPVQLVGPGLSAAMQLLSGTDALILDLRNNGGGSPESVSHLVAHFFALGDERHINDIYSRDDGQTRQFWTSPTVMPRYIKPIYVLTSKNTFSGGEECAYDLQTQKRATLVGETTGGGANPGRTFAVGSGMVAFIPNMRSINPVTHTNWEHTGVKPDIAVDAALAQQVAYVAILRDLLAKATKPPVKARLQGVLADAEAKLAAQTPGH